MAPLWRECRHVHDPLIPPDAGAGLAAVLVGELTCGSVPVVTTRDRLILEACGPGVAKLQGQLRRDGEAWGVHLQGTVP